MRERSMRIESASAEVLKIPVGDAYQAAGRPVDANWHVLARVRTSDGVEGVGYILQPRGDLMRTIASGAAELAEHLVGMDVRDTETAWQSLARWANWIGPGGLLHWSLAPLDIAIWGALGKNSRPTDFPDAWRLSSRSGGLCERSDVVQRAG